MSDLQLPSFLKTLISYFGDRVISLRLYRFEDAEQPFWIPLIYICPKKDVESEVGLKDMNFDTLESAFEQYKCYI